MGKRIVLCFDGTWNHPDERLDETNVVKLFRLMSDKSADGTKQHKWYDDGVGNHWYDFVNGGAFGDGLDHKILDGYTYLISTYDEGDDVFIFGFSRGAYTARSLVGLLRKCGLIKRSGILSDQDIETLQSAVAAQAAMGSSDSSRTQELLARMQRNATIRAAFHLYRTFHETPDVAEAERFVDRYSIRIPIRFLGVWDTVGSLGIPDRIELIKPAWFERFDYERYRFHDVKLSREVKTAYHAVAVDEHRQPFTPTLWEPEEEPQFVDPSKADANPMPQELEQCWFVGAHCDVGGGYAQCGLSDIALRWMVEKAKRCGLAVHDALLPSGDRYDGQLHNSLTELWKIFTGSITRRINATSFGHEAVHPTVWSRIANAALRYNPSNEGLQQAPRDLG